MFKLAKFETGTSRTPTISKLGMVVEYIKRRNFPFEKEFKFPA
jgi:hypothetical protein